MLSDALNPEGMRNHGVIIYETKYACIRTYSTVILMLILFLSSLSVTVSQSMW